MNYTVSGVKKGQPFDTPHGQLVPYTVQFIEDEGQNIISINQKPDTPEIKEGDVLTGDIITKTSRAGNEYKGFKKEMGGGTARTSQGAKPAFKDNTESIQKQVALKAAVETVNNYWGVMPAPSTEMTLEDYSKQTVKVFSYYAKSLNADIEMPAPADKPVQSTEEFGKELEKLIMPEVLEGYKEIFTSEN